MQDFPATDPVRATPEEDPHSRLDLTLRLPGDPLVAPHFTGHAILRYVISHSVVPTVLSKLSYPSPFIMLHVTSKFESFESLCFT